MMTARANAMPTIAASGGPDPLEPAAELPGAPEAEGLEAEAPGPAGPTAPEPEDPSRAGTQPGGATIAKSPKSVTTAVNMWGVPAGSVWSGVQLPPARRSIVAEDRFGGPRSTIVTPPPELPLSAAPSWLVSEKRYTLPAITPSEG